MILDYLSEASIWLRLDWWDEIGVFQVTAQRIFQAKLNVTWCLCNSASIQPPTSIYGVCLAFNFVNKHVGSEYLLVMLCFVGHHITLVVSMKNSNCVREFACP